MKYNLLINMFPQMFFQLHSRGGEIICWIGYGQAIKVEFINTRNSKIFGKNTNENKKKNINSLRKIINSWVEGQQSNRRGFRSHA